MPTVKEPGHTALVRLEPCAVKVACTVLRGGNDGNVIALPGANRLKAAGVPPTQAEAEAEVFSEAMGV